MLLALGLRLHLEQGGSLLCICNLDIECTRVLDILVDICRHANCYKVTKQGKVSGLKRLECRHLTLASDRMRIVGEVCTQIGAGKEGEGTTHGRKIRFCHDTGSCIVGKLHLGDLLVYLFHELDDEVDEFVFEHGFGMEVGDEEGDVVAGDGFSAEDDEAFGSLHEEAGELVSQDAFDFVGLFDTDADADRIDTGLDEDLFALVAGDRKRLEQYFARRARLDFGLVMAFYHLRSKVLQRHRRGQCRAHA